MNLYELQDALDYLENFGVQAADLELVCDQHFQVSIRGQPPKSAAGRPTQLASGRDKGVTVVLPTAQRSLHA
jgi:hypothetical protein